MPEHDDFDDRLVQRLRAYESRIPAAEIPMTDASPARGRSRLAAAGGVVALGALTGVVLALVLLNRSGTPTGESSPTPTASSSARPSSSASATETPATPSDQAAATPTPVAAPSTTVILGDSGSAL